MSEGDASSLEARLREVESELTALRSERDGDAAHLAEQLKLFEAMIETVPVGVAITDADGQIVQGNKQLERMVRHPIFHSRDAEAYGEWVSFHADGRRVQSLEYPLARVLREDIDEAELIVHYQRGDGTRIWMRIIGKAVRDEGGELLGAAVACVDVDEEMALRESQEVLIAELNHRVKNAFSVTNAIVGRSLRQADIDSELRGDIDKRLNAYALAHATLVGLDYRNAPLDEVAREVLHRIDADRITISGDPVTLTTRMALPFSMAFYELASNATKYGSLASEEGTADLTWHIVRGNGEPTLELSWIERGGEPVVEPSHEGFGSFVTGRALKAETGGDVRRLYGPEGFEWHFTMPLPDAGNNMASEEITRVFIVEDEVFVAYEISDILEDLGFTVVGPSLSVEDAQKQARTAQIDAAFLDVNLGGGKTSEPVAAILRERGVPFVFVTAYTANQITFRTSDDRVVEKPVTSDKILAILRTVLPDLEVAPDKT